MKLFVYGTLRRGSRHPLALRLHAAARFLGPARMPGRLYRRGTYPIAVYAHPGRGYVEGELWELGGARRLLAELDRYEGCGKGQGGGEFVRRQVWVETPRGGVRAWAWVARREPRGLPRLRSGTFQPARRSPRATASNSASSHRVGRRRRSAAKRWAGKVTG